LAIGSDVMLRIVPKADSPVGLPCELHFRKSFL